MISDDEITSAYYLYDAEDQNDLKTLSRAEQRLKTAIRLARWAESKGKEELQSEIDRLAPIGMEAVKEEIEQARASAYQEAEKKAYQKGLANAPLPECCLCHKESNPNVALCADCYAKHGKDHEQKGREEAFEAIEREATKVFPYWKEKETDHFNCGHQGDIREAIRRAKEGKT